MTNVTRRRHDVGMCSRCDGISEEDIARGLETAILVTGFAVQVVERSSNEGWCYTIGLSDVASGDFASGGGEGHPDLVMVDTKLDMQQEVLGVLARAIVAGESITELLDEIDAELVPVHPANLSGDLVASWVRRHRRFPQEGEFLQVLLGASWFCSCHGGRRRRLDVPVRNLTGPRGNRAQRRDSRR